MTTAQFFPVTFAARGQYPWSAIVLCSDGSIASGFVVAPNWVLTCAHVPVQPYDRVMINGCDLSVRDGQIGVVGERQVNPDYDPKTHNADLALLHILSADAIDVAPLPYGGVPEKFETVKFEVVGWGQAFVGDPAPGDLRAVRFLTGDAPPGEKEFTRLFTDLATNGVWRGKLPPPPAGPGGLETIPSEGGISFGDSGAPLIYEGRAIAVISFQQPVDGGLKEEDFAIALEPFRPWIEKTTGA